MRAVHTCWGTSDDLIRTGNPAVRQDAAAIASRETVARPACSVTIDNEHYPRFAGTLHLVRRDLAADPRVNVVGDVAAQDRIMLDLLQAGDRFRLVWES
jgi:hypothetical protein